MVAFAMSCTVFRVSVVPVERQEGREKRETRESKEIKVLREYTASLESQSVDPGGYSSSFSGINNVL